MKIAFFEVSKIEQPIFIELLAGVDISFCEEKLSESNLSLAKDADVLCVFANSLITKNIIDSLPNLKSIITRSTGFDHIDFAYANSKNIKVSNVPAYGSETVAEFAFSLILTLSRKIREDAMGLKKDGDYAVLPDMQGFDLSEKTLGVIGTGKIGKDVIHIAHGFNMNVVAYDLFPDLNLNPYTKNY